MNTNPPAATYDAQLAARVADVLPDTDNAERLELLGVMDPDDMRTSLAWLISHAPQLFDFALVRDLAMVERLEARLNEGQADDDEPYCSRAAPAIGVFHGHRRRLAALHRPGHRRQPGRAVRRRARARDRLAPGGCAVSGQPSPEYPTPDALAVERQPGDRLRRRGAERA